MKKILFNFYLLVSLVLISNICFAYNDNKNNFKQNNFKKPAQQTKKKPPIKNETMDWGGTISSSMVLLIVGNIAFWGYTIVKSTKKEIKFDN